MDEAVTQFVSITGAPVDKATQYINISDNNLERAIELYFETGGVDLIGNLDAPNAAFNPPPIPHETRPGPEDEIMNLDSDDEDLDDDVQTISRGTRSRPSAAPTSVPQPLSSTESDEAIARRLQEEMYAGGDMPGVAGTVDADGYRAPIARTRETLVGPEPFDPNDPEGVHAAIAEQMAARRGLYPYLHDRQDFLTDVPAARARAGRPGIFNQRIDDSRIWNGASSSQTSNFREHLNRSTGGASSESAKSGLLAELYRPPFELISPLSWEEARDEGKAENKWILVNVQDSSIFDCQVLNRDIWKHEGIRETIRENFIFMQYSKEDPRGQQYMQYYFQDRDNQDAYPHIAIVDPRTGEQVKKWSGPPIPKASEFLMQLHEFLDRYSLSVTAKNPVAKRKPEPRKGVDSMTEEEQLEMAMQASLVGRDSASTANSGDPDDLTRSIGDMSKSPALRDHENISNHATVESDGGTPTAAEIPPTPASATSPFAVISSTLPHTEPAPTDPDTTRIQFRHPEGRVVRRFALGDPVRRLYEWLKAEPLPGKEGVAFELVSMGKNLIDSLDQTVSKAGLRNGTVMVEFVDGDGE